MNQRINSHRELIVYQKSFAAGKRVFELSKQFPREEMYSLTDQIRRSSRSVSANIAEVWRKRRYEKHFCSTLNIAEAEAAETQVWIEYSAAHGYLNTATAKQTTESYEEIIRMIVAMIYGSSKWCVVNSNDAAKEGLKPNEHVRESVTSYSIDDAPELDQSTLLSPVPNSPTRDSSTRKEKRHA